MPTKAELLILGCASANPTAEAFPTAQHLQMSGRSFLLDCGEGTQMQLRKYKVSMSRISVIFISHLHGDHYFGLPGLISSFHLLGRESELTVVGPKGLKDIIFTILRAQGTLLKHPIKFVEIESEMICYEDEKICVQSVEMDHRIACFGYLFREKPHKRKLKKSAIGKYDIPIYKRDNIKRGEDLILASGEEIPNELLTEPADPSKSYMFFSDTSFQESKAHQMQNVDLVYHESTFARADHQKAVLAKHSTTTEAAQMGARHLLIGHFSSRYKDKEALLKEAQTIFKNTDLAYEGLRISW